MGLFSRDRGAPVATPPNGSTVSVEDRTSAVVAPANTDEPVAPSTGKSRQELLRDQCLELLRAGKIEEFNQTRPAGELDFRGCNLSNRNLTGADLRNIDFSYANLRGVNLTGAKLQRSIFDRTDLSQSTLNDAKFLEAVFNRTNLCEVRSAKKAEFHNAKFFGAELNKGNFREAFFVGAQLITASMMEGKFCGADFSNALLAGAMVAGADFSYANLQQSRLFQANGRDVNFTGANLTNAEANRTFFTSSNLDPKQGTVLKTTFDGAWVRGFKHDEHITHEMLLGSISENLPPEGTFKKSPEATDEKILVNGIPGSDKIRYDKAMQQLEELIGLVEVKTWVKQLIDFQMMKMARGLESLPDLDKTLHTLFMGGPGTGKTTVARIVSELLASIGALSKGHLVESDKSGFIAGYAGQTMGKTDELINSAIGGVLIVDEFYALLQDQNDAYAKDAVAKLLKRMEDDRDKFCLIGAGYTRETQETLEKNSGFNRRFPNQIIFPDYSSGQLVDIMKLMLNKKKFVPTPELLASASMVLVTCKEIQKEYFGNGGAVRNVFEEMCTRMASRLVAEDRLKDREALTTPKTFDIGFHKATKIEPEHFPKLEDLRWEGKDGKELTYKELPLKGEFPNMTQASVKLLADMALTHAPKKKKAA